MQWLTDRKISTIGLKNRYHSSARMAAADSQRLPGSTVHFLAVRFLQTRGHQKHNHNQIRSRVHMSINTTNNYLATQRQHNSSDGKPK